MLDLVSQQGGTGFLYTKNQVEAIFRKIDLDKTNSIDFFECIEVCKYSKYQSSYYDHLVIIPFIFKYSIQILSAWVTNYFLNFVAAKETFSFEKNNHDIDTKIWFYQTS